MAEEQATDNGEVRKIGPVETYDILLQRNINGDRLLTERTTIFLAANSILFLAFVMLFQPSLTVSCSLVVSGFRIFLAIAGLFLTWLLHDMNRATHNALEFLWGAQEKIERSAPEFSYMRKQRIRPQKDGWQFTSGQKKWDKKKNKPIVQNKWWRKPKLFSKASCVWLPLTFGILWIVALIVSCLSL